MENYGFHENGKDEKSKEKADSTTKPTANASKSLAELLIKKEDAGEHKTIWERDEKPKKTAETKPEIKESDVSLIAKPEQVTILDSPEASDEALAELTPDEANAIARQYTATRSAELRDEQVNAPAESPEQAAATAVNLSMLQKLAERLHADTDADPEQASAKAFIDAANEAGLEVPRPDVASPEIAVLSPTAETEEVDDEQAVPSMPVGSSASSGTSSVPPRPPLPPRPSFGPGFPGGGINPNLAPGSVVPNVAPTPNMIPASEATYYARQAENRGLLVGGVVGYLVGRRRGRIKTEKRLLPVQRKLERQVTKLHDTIASREQQIRTLAVEKVRIARDAQEAVPAVGASRPDRLVAPVPASLRTPATLPSSERPLAPAAVISSFEQHPQAELTPISSLQASTPESRLLVTQLPESIERMNQQELLHASETVIIEGASLRSTYEANRITERGLRHVMTEYLRGGDVKKALDQELAIKELTYERDPQMRARMTAGPTMTGTTGGGQANAANAAAQVVMAASVQPKATAALPSATTVNRPTNPHQNSDPLRDTLVKTWIVGVVFLVLVAVILLFR